MTTHDRLFLIVYDRQQGAATVEDFGHDVDVAMAAYSTRERELVGDEMREVVLLGAPSLEALRRTHSSYFGAGESLGSALAGHS